MRLHRPVLAGIALGALLPVTAAEAATGVSAAGSALSSATLVSVTVGDLLGVVDGATLSVGTLAAAAQNVTDKDPAVTFTPYTLNGVKNGTVSVTPANSPKTVGGVSTGALAGGVVGATTPGATLMASKGAKPSSALTSSLGAATVLGLPITVGGGLDAGSTAEATQAMAAKGLTLSDVTLPNIADLVAALGIDMAKLPAATLNALINDLRIAISSATQALLDDANTAIDGAVQDVTDTTAVLTQEEADFAAAAAVFDAIVDDAVVGAVPLPSGVTAPLSAAEWSQLDDATKLAIEALNPGLQAAADTYEAAETARDQAQDAVDDALAALDTALGVLAGIVEGVLGDVPLVSVGAAEIGTKALVSKTAKVADVTGFVSGVEVLGTDVLADITGSSEIDLADLAGDVADDVNAAINTATTALSNALSGVTGATGLVVPAPQVSVLTKSTKTGTDGAYGTASATVTALTISLGSVTVPAAYALADAAQLPGLAPIADGFQTAPLSMKVGALVESARFRAGTTTPTTPTGPTHPATGLPAGLAVVAMIGTALAVGVRRFRTTAE